MELASEGLVLQEQPAKADQAVDLGQQVLEEDRLHQVVVRPAPEGGDGVLDRGIGRDHDEQRLRADLERRFRTVRPSAPGSWTSQRTTSGSNASTRASAEGMSRGRRHLEALALEELLERRGDHLLVVDDQDPAPRRRVGSRALASSSHFSRATDFIGISSPTLAASGELPRADCSSSGRTAADIERRDCRRPPIRSIGRAPGAAGR